MKVNIYLTLLIFLRGFVYCQVGCPDLQANNYNSSATTNDGTCTYNVTMQATIVKGSVASYANESSGVVFADGAIWTHNDSGNPAKIFKTDTANGHLLQTLSVTNFFNIDWEDITADSSFLYIGDFGNNNGTRTDLKVLKIDKAQYLTSTLSVVSVTAQAINFTYSDQLSFTSNSNTNFDCESVISIGSYLYLFTKDRGDFQTRVYKLSKTPGTYTISPYTSYNVNGKITGADYNKLKNEVALIGYLSSDRNSFIYFLNDFTGDMFFSGNKRRIEIGNSVNQWQTEGIAYAGLDSTELFLSCETSYTPATLYTTVKSSMSFQGIKENYKDSKFLNIYPNPASDMIFIKTIDTYEIENVVFYNVMGEEICCYKIMKGINSFDISRFPPGVYFIKSINSSGYIDSQKVIKN
jgi:hypothetical protein